MDNFPSNTFISKFEAAYLLADPEEEFVLRLRHSLVEHAEKLTAKSVGNGKPQEFTEPLLDFCEATAPEPAFISGLERQLIERQVVFLRSEQPGRIHLVQLWKQFFDSLMRCRWQYGVIMSLAVLVALSVFLLAGRGEIFSIREATSLSGGTTNLSTARWVSQARTVDQLMAEADLVVKARVSEAPITRVVRNELPIMDEKGKEIGFKVDELAFSDTVFEVVEVYSGKSSSKITVMQTGGSIPENYNGQSEMADDPLYKVGEEYVLFLVDISGDPVQAPGRELYRIVNPSGRYQIDGTNVSSYGENIDSVRLPATLDELEAQIKKDTQP
jgi:hypothetical protein